jgi:hypothetical protein
MRTNWTYDLKFSIDPKAGETNRQTVFLEGIEYEINIAPAEQMRRARTRTLHREGIGGIEKDAISLGPRGGPCACCGK